jgi:hypothetical protein
MPTLQRNNDIFSDLLKVSLIFRLDATQVKESLDTANSTENSRD